jgi:hypothetical protein
MAGRNELELFAVRGAAGGFQMMTDQGVVVVEGATWRAMRVELDRILAGSPVRPIKLTILVGRPPSRRPPARVPSAPAGGRRQTSRLARG